MAECDPPSSSYPGTATNSSSVDEVSALDCLGGRGSEQDVSLLENLSAESGTGALVDSEVLDSVVRELCGGEEGEGEGRRYSYLTTPPKPKKGPISSFCSYVGGKFNREPEQMINSETGAVALSEASQALIRGCFADISPEEVVDYHTHIVGHGEDETGSTGCYLHPGVKSWKNPTKHLKGLVFLSACQVADRHSGDLQFVSRLLRLITHFVPSSLLPSPSSSPFQHGHNCILALDKLYAPSGAEDLSHTSLYVPNTYVVDLARDSPGSFYPVGSVHPYRPDALEELEWCSAHGISIIKWLPNSQGIDPSSDKCDTFYRKMVELDLTLLTHTGDEHAVNFAYLNNTYGNPLLLRRPLNLGVRIIAAHVATEGSSEDLDSSTSKRVACFDLLLRLMREDLYKDTLFADISAVTGFKRVPYLQRLLAATDIHPNLVYGSDYPIPAINIVVSVGKIVKAGLLTQGDGNSLREIYHYNPLLFDFCLKRRLTGVNSERFPASVFKRHPKIAPHKLA